MKTIKQVLGKTKVLRVVGESDLIIKNIQIDSRLVKKGTLYIALVGTKLDGHEFINQAIKNGSKCIVCQKEPTEYQKGITYVLVENTAMIAGFFLNNFYDNLSSKLKMVGVTGTNGKTSTVTLLYELFQKLGHRAGLISTVCNVIHKTKINSTHTTPDVVSLYALLNKMYQAKCEYVFMECSSHAIHQYRISGLQFKAAIFINITHDHLDYHKTFKNYIYAKKAFFDRLDKNCFALVNADDKNANIMLQNTQAKKKTFALKTVADFQAKIVSNNLDGLELNFHKHSNVHFRLIGEFNAYNLLAVFSTAIVLGQKAKDVLPILSDLKSPEGRFDIVISKEKKIYGIVDYAHTPDALKNVLKTIQKSKQKNQNVFVVIGCGGDRDKLKRPLMAKIGAELSTYLILTSDNPRSEKPQSILDDMKKGLDKQDLKKTFVIENREEAIKKTVELAKPKDIILVAGKGHESYQEILGIKYPFNDKQILTTLFNNF